MAVLIDDTIGGEYSNSYADITFADEYFADHFDATKTATWEDLSDGQKQQLLVQATLLLEQLKFTYVMERRELSLHYDSRTGLVHDFLHVQYPVRYTWNQNLQFPRNLDVDSVTGARYIPEAVMIAQCEVAMGLKTFSAIDMTATLSGIKRKAVELPGPIKQDITYSEGGAVTTFSSISSMSPLAVQYLTPYLVWADRVYRS